MKTNTQMVRILQEQCRKAGSAYKWVSGKGISRNMIHQVLAHKVPVSERVANLLGYTRQIVFLPKPVESKEIEE